MLSSSSRDPPQSLVHVTHLPKMATCASFQVQVASIMEVLAKTAVAEITKLVDDGSAVLRLQMCRSQRENEALKTKLLLMEGELRAVRGYGEGTPGNSLNLSFEVQVCDEFREEQRPNVAGKGTIPVTQRVFDEQLSRGSAKDDQNVHVEKKRDAPDDLDIYSLRIGWKRIHQSQVEQNIGGEITCGISGAAAVDGGGEGPLCDEEELHMQPCPAGDPEKELQAELKQEPEEQPLTPTLPLSVDLGLELQSVWSEATSSGIILGKRRRRRRRSALEDAWLEDDRAIIIYIYIY
ncbi:hypothetical protein COCON_G00101430 [Conger conger]|uniref:Uncharacterized protein n=1 Tax=Conger conger TaxID=82655 RepID=A0A9Q1DI16_CONCO|nr:hypothetical protein COCON_G00101430 [Conger conger]